jgi:DNA-binding response OmpR family regulator
MFRPTFSSSVSWAFLDVLVSYHMTDETRREALNVGVDACMQKPVDAKAILALVGVDLDQKD